MCILFCYPTGLIFFNYSKVKKILNGMRKIFLIFLFFFECDDWILSGKYLICLSLIYEHHIVGFIFLIEQEVTIPLYLPVCSDSAGGSAVPDSNKVRRDTWQYLKPC